MQRNFSVGVYALLLSRRQPISLFYKTNFLRILSSAGFGTTSGPTPQANQDLYHILGVEKSASAKDIKAAYYELSKKYHPDVGGSQGNGDARHFHQITEAYETLGNEDKRRAYDEERMRATRMYDTTTGYSDPDLQTLREFQRKWNLRRQQFNRDQTQQRPKRDFDFENAKDKEKFESFYRRYRENVAKARKWDESSDATFRNQQGTRREQYTDFQKEMLRKKHMKQKEYENAGVIFTVAVFVTLVVLFFGGGGF